MSHINSFLGSGSRTCRRTFEFGRTYVVRPIGKHQATIVWLHGLGDNGSSSSQLLESLPLPNIKWICPTSPTLPVAILGGFPCTACDEVVPYRYGERSGQVLSSAGYCNLTFKAFEGVGHYTVPREMDQVCNWLSARLQA